jgi:hypothetical protein
MSNTQKQYTLISLQWFIFNLKGRMLKRRNRIIVDKSTTLFYTRCPTVATNLKIWRHSFGSMSLLADTFWNMQGNVSWSLTALYSLFKLTVSLTRGNIQYNTASTWVDQLSTAVTIGGHSELDYSRTDYNIIEQDNTPNNLYGDDTIHKTPFTTVKQDTGTDTTCSFKPWKFSSPMRVISCWYVTPLVL